MKVSKWVLPLFGLLLSLPFLVPVHDMPLPSFYSEGLALLLGLLALLVWLLRRSRLEIEIPIIVTAPLALVLVVLVQWAAGMFAYGATAMIMVLFLLWCSLLMLAGRSLASGLGVPRLLTGLAWYMLAGGVLNALCGLLQYGNLWQGLAGWVAAPMEEAGAGVYGNVAQQNHFATHLALAMAAACYLCFTRQLHKALYAAAILLLFCALMLSGSRSSLLYLLWIIVLSLGLLKQGGLRQHGRKIVLGGLGLGLALALALGLVWALAGHGVPQIDRLMTLLGGLGVRAYLWRHALTMFLSHPLMGVGFDAFAFQLVGQLHALKEASQWGIDQYAHNLWLQLLAVAGLSGFLALFVPVVLWFRRQWKMDYSAGQMLLWAWLGILLIHSMLEQPLYFAYFLGLAALALGLADTKVVRAPPGLRPGALVLLLFGLGLLIKTGYEYDQLESYFYSQRAMNGPQALEKRQQLAQSLQRHSLLAPLIELVAPAEFVPDSAAPEVKIAFNRRVRHFAPVAETEYREAALLAEAGRAQAAQDQFDCAAYAYPGQTKVYLPRIFALAESDPDHYMALAVHAREFVLKMHGKLD